MTSIGYEGLSVIRLWREGPVRIFCVQTSGRILLAAAEEWPE